MRYRGEMVNSSGNPRRDRILLATVELIRRDGVAALTTKRIAAEAGCAEGTIFRHFGDKGGLIAAVLSFGLPELSRLEELAHIATDGDVEARLVRLCSAVIDYYRASYPIAAAALSDTSVFERYSVAHLARGTGPLQVWNLVFDFLHTAQMAGSITDAIDLEIEAIALTGACQNAVWVGLVNGDTALPHGGERFAERLVGNRIPALTVAG
jgi:AcrR family transcriptional regulator